MDAIILAAGKGTRLLPYTKNIPKPLLPVQGRPILDWILAALPPVDRVIVVVNYLAEQIESYLQNQRHVKHWTTVRQDTPRGTGDALLSCRGKCIAEHVMVLNGDDLIGRADLTRLAAVPMGILVHPVMQPEAFGIVDRKADGTLAHIQEKPQGLTPPQLANIGGYLFPKSVFEIELKLSPRGEYEITDAVAQLAAQGPFHVVESKYWLPIGDVNQWCWSQLADVEPVK